VKRINPIYLLIVLNVLLILFRDLLLSEETITAIGDGVESALVALGPFGYAGLALAFALCGFFFIPLMIPLGILAGALYGAWGGTAVSLIGIVLSTATSTVAVRHVFTGMQPSIEKRPKLKRLIAGADRHINLVIVTVRFAVVVPPLFQNLALALTGASLTRLMLVTSLASLPGAAIYSFLGAGLVKAERVTDLTLYLAVPVLLMVGLSLSLAWFRSRLGDPAD
jgi:uncharacterized membrane protein YdjX (TVP38/TMEM64 family)